MNQSIILTEDWNSARRHWQSVLHVQLIDAQSYQNRRIYSRQQEAIRDLKPPMRTVIQVANTKKLNNVGLYSAS